MRVKGILAIGLVAAAGLSACTTGADTSAEASSTGSPAGTVRLLTHDSFVLSQSLIDDLEARTGLSLEVVTAGDAGSMVAGAILAAGAPAADLLFGVDNTLRSRAVDAGVFSPYASPAADALRPELRDDTSGGLLTAIDVGDVCVNIDDGYFAKAGLAPPATLEDLAAPEYRDLLVVEDPGTSSPGLAFLLATVARFGEQWPDFWSRLAANGVKVAGSWTDAYMGDFTMGGGGGDRPLVVSYATSPPAEIVYAADPKPDRPSTSVMTDGCYRQVEYAGVLAGASNPAGAQAVLDWLLSPEVQADLPMSMFVLPARDGIALPEVFTRFAPEITDPLQIPAEEVAAGVPGWLAEWGAVMGR